MRRRDVLKLTASAAMLAAPHIARAQRPPHAEICSVGPGDLA
jgi:hypothetical protein